ncbi:succinate dehydrogenase cytochrome b subunit [Propionibacterium sp.]|uniref:succinate dehydrogenase cytochrome b subunit n=1 Tax=Propionibacterium sp. TaxID=1977903 RepID=UPI0039EA6D46
MATLTTLSADTTPQNRAVRSSVTKKFAMSVTGLVLVAFLLMHMFGNLKLLISGEDFDAYAHALRHLLEPVLPPYFFLTCFRLVIAACVIVHFVMALHLSIRDSVRHAHSAGLTVRRYTKRRYLEGSFVARTMIWSGIIILLFIPFHLLMFTDQIIKIGYSDPATPSHMRVVLAFQNWGIYAIYFIAMLCIALHVWHGFYSAFCTLGWRVGYSSTVVIKACAWIVSFLVFFGFMLVPTLIAIGVINS